MLRILIVDDNSGFISLLKEMLEEEGRCRVATAGNGEDGYRTFLRFRPDVILTDIEMPLKNGLEMVKKIRMCCPRIKIIYMSGHLKRYREVLEKEIKEYKASLIDKPFSFSKVVRMFDEYRNEIKLPAVSGGVSGGLKNIRY